MVVVPLLYAYFVLVIPFLVVWLILFVFNKTLRQKQWLTSIAGAILGPISEVAYFKDYWHPLSIFSINIYGFNILVEDLLFGFSIGGIAGIAYDIFSKSQSNREPCIPSNFFSMTIALLTPFIMFLFLWLNGVNSILASSFGALLGTVVIVYQRKDLVLNAIWSGLLTVGVLFSVYFLLTLIVANEEILMQAIWLLNSTNLDVRLHGIPLTELFWAFSCGSFLSPFYETVSSLWRITPNNYRVNSVCSVQ